MNREMPEAVSETVAAQGASRAATKTYQIDGRGSEHDATPRCAVAATDSGISKRLLAFSLGLCVAALLATGAPDSGAADVDQTASRVKTLRDRAVDAPVEMDSDNYRAPRDQAALPRDFVQQPPLIPHTTKGYTITKNYNKCLDCHSWARAQETGATKISVTHFRDREGTELGGVSARRYFCQQCHVPQTDAKPLVGNTFRRAQGMN